MKKIFKIIALTGFIIPLAITSQISAQTIEPEVETVVRNLSNIQSEYDAGFGFNIIMNNFGVGLGGEYRRVLGTSNEITVSLRGGGLRDASEQTFTDYFFGQRIIPNKYQRAFVFPMLLGLRHRLFSNIIQEDYRFFVSASIGPAASFSYPYFRDDNNNGYREQFSNYFERVNDVFSGWNNGDWHFGGAGEMKIGLDIGKNFSRLNSIEFGYYFYYFPDGIQIMMPNQPVTEINPETGRDQIVVNPDTGEIVVEPYFDDQKFFGSPQITFTFGWLW